MVADRDLAQKLENLMRTLKSFVKKLPLLKPQCFVSLSWQAKFLTLFSMLLWGLEGIKMNMCIPEQFNFCKYVHLDCQ